MNERISTGSEVGTVTERVSMDPMVCHGKPVIRGTRVMISVLLDCLAGGMSFDEVAEAYLVTVEDVRAAIEFAGELLDQWQYRRLTMAPANTSPPPDLPE